MAEILNSGRNKIALQQGNSQPLNVTKFVFANIPGLDPADPVDLAQGLPAAEHIVFEKLKTAQGYVASDQVVYSVILIPTEGDFDFNWVGLVDADNVLIAVSYTPVQHKFKTVGLNVGNTLTRNFLLQFNNAQAITGITVAAEAWQIDFIGRLDNADETIRADMRDVFGDGCFLGDGFLVVSNAGVISAKAGVGYVGGYRATLANDTVINAGVLPKDIYVDCVLEGDVSGTIVTIELRASTAAVPLSNYLDANNKQHYVVKIASVSAANVVTDLRKKIPANLALIDYLLSMVAALANVARTGNAEDLIGTLNAARLPFSYGTASTANYVVQRDANGHVSLPTAPLNDNSTKGATTAYVMNAINALIGAAPGALNALDELAAALGNDPNFATTMTNLIATKAPLSSPTFTGTPKAPTAPQGTNTTQLATTAHVFAAIAALATVARTGNAADLTGTLNAARLPFSYSINTTASHVAQRDGAGNLLVPNVPINEYSLKAANTGFVIDCVNAAINALVGAAPSTLNTLAEIATALGNNANLATTLTNQIAAKAPLASPALTGTPTAPTPAVNANTKQLANAEFVQLIAAGLMEKSPAMTLVHMGSALSVSLDNQFGFFVVYTTAPNVNAHFPGYALIYKGDQNSTQTIVSVDGQYYYMLSVRSSLLRCYRVNKATVESEQVSINYVYKIG